MYEKRSASIGCVFAWVNKSDPGRRFILVPKRITMHTLKTILFYFLLLVSTLLIIGTLLSIPQDVNNRFLKMLDFPRIQFFLSGIICLVIFLIVNKKWNFPAYALAAGLLFVPIFQAFFILDYTPVLSVSVPGVEEGDYSEEKTLSLLMANVLQSNRESRHFVEQIEKYDPDIVLAMETDAWWQSQIETVAPRYPHRKEVINDKAYGMMLYSKYPMQNVEVKYFNNENVPSIHGTIYVADRPVRFHAMHPVPPTLFEKYPDNAGQKEQAMEILGKMLDEEPRPQLIFGDFNDVAWSNTTELLEANAEVNDVRRGRWFYNTFNANSWWRRWPLDHILVSEEFGLKALVRTEDINSDHFPIYAELVLVK